MRFGAYTMTNKTIFRMSESGYCPRALSAMKLEYTGDEIPTWLETAAREGEWHEQRIKMMLAEEEHWFMDNEQKEVILEYPNFNLVGHIDGMVIKSPEYCSPDDLDKDGDGIWYLLEIKSMSQFQFDRWMREGFEGFFEYKAQLACYLFATELTHAMYIVKNRSSGYLQQQFLNRDSSFQDTFKLVLERLSIAHDAIMKKELAPAEYDAQRLECRRCPYTRYCIKQPDDLTPIQEEELKKAAVNWRIGKSMSKEADKLLNDAKVTFQQHTKASGLEKWKYDDLAIQIIHVNKPEHTVAAKEYDMFRIDDIRKEKNND